MAKSSKRKPAPKPTYTYVEDEKAPAGSKKRGVTGGIKKEKTSSDNPIPRKDVVTRRNTREDIRARQGGEEAKRVVGEGFRKRQEKEIGGELTQARRIRIADDLAAMPKGELPKRKEGLKASRADFAAGPARVPARGTKPSTAPAKPDRGAEIGGAMTVGKGSGARDAISGTYRGGRTVEVEKTTKEKVYKGVTYSDPEPVKREKFKKVAKAGPRKGKTVSGERIILPPRFGYPDKSVETAETSVKTEGHAYQSDVKTTSTDTREMRSKESIAETNRRAKNRIPGGLKTTQFDPMGTSAKSTGPASKTKKTEKKLRRRAETGKINLPRRYGMGAAAAAVAATEASVPKKVKTPTVSGSTVSAYMFSDESLAQELARTHFKGHGASEIMDYVKHTGSDMGSFHRHVTEAHKAETKKIKVGSGDDVRERSAGKITRWRVDPKTGTEKSARGYEGWQKVNVRDASGANVKTWKKFSAPQGSSSHIEYLHRQITKHKEMRAMEAADTRELNRSRKVADTTSAIVESMSGSEATPAKVTPPQGKTGAYLSKKPRPKDVAGPELESGAFSEKRVPQPRPRFTEVKGPRKRRNLNP